MKQLALVIVLSLLTGLAMGDFTLKDPALPDEEEGNELVTEMAGDYAVEGAGVKTCTEYQADRKKNSSMHYFNLNWAKGFITGVNYIHVNTLGNSQLGAGLDMDSLTLWIDNYCKNKPNATLSDASAALVDELIQ